jgi:hypothetical protein
VVGFYERFIPDYSRPVAPSTNLNKAKFVCNQEEVAFDMLKQALCEAPVFQIPDFTRNYVSANDASDLAVSAK